MVAHAGFCHHHDTTGVVLGGIGVVGVVLVGVLVVFLWRRRGGGVVAWKGLETEEGEEVVMVPPPRSRRRENVYETPQSAILLHSPV